MFGKWWWRTFLDKIRWARVPGTRTIARPVASSPHGMDPGSLRPVSPSHETGRPRTTTKSLRRSRLTVIGGQAVRTVTHSKGRAMANAPNAKTNAVRLDRGRPRNLSTTNRSSRWRWITWGILSGAGRAPTACPLGVIQESRQPNLRERPRSSKSSKACPRPSNDEASLMCANAFLASARKLTFSAVKL